MSARDRRPMTGRSNYSNSGLDKDGAKTWMQVTRSDQLKDPLLVRRPYTPEAKQIPVITRKAYLAKDRHNIVNEPESLNRPRKGTICPPGFVEHQMEPTWFEKIDSKAMVDERFKTEMAREFVDRNRDRMWMYDIKYHKQTPRTSCNMVLEEMNFMKMMKVYHRMENALDRGTSSHRIMACFDESKLEPVARGKPSYNTFGSSCTTSRELREERVNNILRPSMRSAQDSYRRGALHAPDWGNFSRYNAFLSKNA